MKYPWDEDSVKYFLQILEAISRLDARAQAIFMRKIHWGFNFTPLDVLRMRLMNRWGKKL